MRSLPALADGARAALARVLVPALAGLSLLAAGCSTVPPGSAGAGTWRPWVSVSLGASAATPSGPTGPSAPVVAPGSPPPFAAVIKGARRIDGPLVMWQKDDKVWFELLPEQFGQPFLLSPKIKSGIGEAWVLGGLMAYPVNGAGGSQVVEFVRVHNQVRLQARNMEVAARAGSPEARAVADAYSHSLLGSTAVASQPHPDRQSVLVEANGLFLSDMLGIGMMLQRGLQQGYGLDRNNTVITAARATPQASILETQAHFYAASIALPGPGAAPGAPSPAVPRFLPDTRSMLIGLHYSLAPLPDTPMPVRRADPRIGLFTTTVLDFSDDLSLTPRQRYVTRWRLEKKDPSAAVSDPVKPITFWIDRNVPLAYRDTVRAAILEWNKAFEKIGIHDAIVVRQQPDDARFDTLDFGIASVRWMMDAAPVFGAIGPSHVDPRTGEILDADIAFEGMSARGVRSLRSQVLAGPTAGAALLGLPASMAAGGADAGFDAGLAMASRCLHGELAAEQLGYALDVLQARDDLAPDSPVAQQFVLDYIKESIMHEVGHALGLRHNFRASRAYTEAQLADPEFTREHGTTGSVMEYNAVNLPSPGRTGGLPFQTALGPYDYWAIDYAYRPMPAGTTPEAERIELQRIASRSSEPLLAFGTDEDNFYGLDPETIQLDLGADPVAFAAKRLAIARDLFKRQETRVLAPDQDYAVLRRSLGFAIADVGRAMGVLARQLGGVRTLRDYPGSGRDPLQPVPAVVQRQSLDLMASALLSTEGLSLSARLQRRLAPDFLDRAESAGGPPDFALPQRLFEIQRALIAYLGSDALAARMLDSVGKFDRPADAFQLGELYQRLSDELWSELGSGQAIAPARRALQREHLNQIASALLRPSATTRADARAALRQQARTLLARVQTAVRKHPVADAGTREHLSNAVETLERALAAPVLRLAL